jgi:hypothetical protein
MNINSRSIAQEIWSQMNAIDRNLVWCMGVNKPVTIQNGLQFNVSGLSFKGIVQITLNGGDLYDVKFIKPTRVQNQVAKQLGVKKFDIINEVVEEVNDVFVEDLMPLLEDRVENRSNR